MALKKKPPTQNESIREEIKTEPTKILNENSNSSGKKKFGFINKSPKEEISNLSNAVEKNENIQQNEEEITINSTDPKDNTEEETKNYQDHEGEYNPELIKNYHNQLENLGNIDLVNAFDKSYSFPEENDKSEKEEYPSKFGKEEILEKPKENEKKKGFKFMSKGKTSSQKKEINENESNDGQAKSTKDFDDLRDNDRKKEYNVILKFY